MIKKTLYFGNPSVLRIKDKQLVIETIESESGKKKIATLAVEDIGAVILDHQQIMISQRVLQLLLEQNCCIMLCSEKHMPQGLMMPFEGNTIQTGRYINQIDASQPLKKQLWQQTVVAKIRNQASLLRAQGIRTENMLTWAKKVNSGDTMNFEARAAAYYWDKLFSGEFRRSRLGMPPNNLLNYGYAVLRAVIARALVGSGLLPTLGIHHRNKYNAFCLADDLMEPYRPYVDRLVLNIIDEIETEPDILTPDLKKQLLSVPVLDVTIDCKRSPLMIAAQRTSASLAACFAGESRKILFPVLQND